MDRPTLLIADHNEDFRQALAEAVREDFTLHCCGDGQRTLELLRCHQPDFLVLDLMLPYLDGLSLLQSATMLPHPPKVLIISRMYTEFVLDFAAQLGIQYIIQKPCPISKAAARLRDIYAAQFRSPEEVSREILLELSFDLEGKSGKTTFRALPMVADDPDISFLNALYPALGPNAERNIRFSIEHAWAVGSPEVWQTYFPGAKKRPSNKVFLRRMAQELNRRLPK